MQEDRNSEDQRIAPRLRETRQWSDRLFTTLLAVKFKLEPRREAFSAASSRLKTISVPLRARIEGFIPKIEPFSVIVGLYCLV